MLKNLTPQFLKTLDGWLLKNWPLVWRTRIHWVLFFSLVVHLLTVVCFGLFPLSMEDLIMENIHFQVQLIAYVFSLFALVYWGYSIVYVPIKSTGLLSILFTGLIYWIGCLSISSNVFATSKLLDSNLMELIDKDALDIDMIKVSTILGKIGNLDLTLVDATKFNKVKELQRIEQKLTRERFNINDLIRNYKIDIPNKEGLMKYEERSYTIFHFIEEFNIPITSVLEKIKSKQELIEYAYLTVSDWSLRKDYIQLVTFLVIMIFVVPILLMILPTLNWNMFFLLLLIHSVCFISIGYLNNSDLIFFIRYKRYGLVLVIILLSKRNSYLFRLVNVLCISFLPILGLSYLFSFEYNYNYDEILLFNDSITVLILYSIVVNVIASILYYQYLIRIKEPSNTILC